MKGKTQRTRGSKKPSEQIDPRTFEITGSMPGEDEMTPEQKKLFLKPLTPREEIFLFEYFKDFNAYKAGRRMGIKHTTMLNKPNVRYEAHRKIKEKITNKDELAAKTLSELEAVSRSDITDFIIIGEGNQRTYLADLSKVDTRSIASIEVNEELRPNKNKNNLEVYDRKVKVKLWDKPRTLDTLSKVTDLQAAENNTNITLNMRVSLDELKLKIRERLLANKEEKIKEFEVMKPDESDDDTE